MFYHVCKSGSTLLRASLDTGKTVPGKGPRMTVAGKGPRKTVPRKPAGVYVYVSTVLCGRVLTVVVTLVESSCGDALVFLQGLLRSVVFALGLQFLNRSASFSNRKICSYL